MIILRTRAYSDIPEQPSDKARKKKQGITTALVGTGVSGLGAFGYKKIANKLSDKNVKKKYEKLKDNVSSRNYDSYSKVLDAEEKAERAIKDRGKKASDTIMSKYTTDLEKGVKPKKLEKLYRPSLDNIDNSVRKQLEANREFYRGKKSSITSKSVNALYKLSERAKSEKIYRRVKHSNRALALAGLGTLGSIGAGLIVGNRRVNHKSINDDKI